MIKKAVDSERIAANVDILIKSLLNPSHKHNINFFIMQAYGALLSQIILHTCVLAGPLFEWIKKISGKGFTGIVKNYVSAFYEKISPFAIAGILSSICPPLLRVGPDFIAFLVLHICHGVAGRRLFNKSDLPALITGIW